MPANTEIVHAISKLVENADFGSNTEYLPEFNQKDVKDTVNMLHIKEPNIFMESSIDWDGLADITFVKVNQS